MRWPICVRVRPFIYGGAVQFRQSAGLDDPILRQGGLDVKVMDWYFSLQSGPEIHPTMGTTGVI